MEIIYSNSSVPIKYNYSFIKKTDASDGQQSETPYLESPSPSSNHTAISSTDWM